MTTVSEDTLNAIRIAMKAEKDAAEFYRDAAEKAKNLSQDLFKRLEQFELFHYQKLQDLLESLGERKGFIEYDSSSLPSLEIGDRQKIDESAQMSLMDVITLALEIEKDAEESYKELVKQTDNEDGRTMFQKLAEEENHHYSILSDAYWNLNEKGEW